MKIAAVCRNKERPRTAHADRHYIGSRIDLITVRCILDRYRHRVVSLDRRVLIVHHVEPEHNSHEERKYFGRQIVLHSVPKLRHHFFLQLRTMSRIDERELYANAGVNICVSSSPSKWR